MRFEKSLEAKCRRLAEQHDGKLLKFSTSSEKGWHDRLLLLKNTLILIEFKRNRKAAVQSLQDVRQSYCDARGIPAFRVHSYAEFVRILVGALNA